MRPKTTLHPSLYKLIYIALKERFITNEWPVESGQPGTEFAIWEKEGENGRHVIYNLFEVNYRYFYERKGWAEDGQPIVMYNDLLNDVLHYVGCEGADVAATRQDFYQKHKVPPDVIMAQAKQPPVRSRAKKNEEKDEKNYTITNAGQVVSAKTVTNQGLEVEPNH